MYSHAYITFILTTRSSTDGFVGYIEVTLNVFILWMSGVISNSNF